MSSQINISSKNAAKFNARESAKWDQLPDYPGLDADPSSAEFVEAVKAYQSEAGLVVDGFLGAQTWGHMVRACWPVSRQTPHLIHRGRRLETSSAIMTWEHPKGLDLHKDGGWAKRATAPRVIVVHWGGLHPRHCRDVLANRDLSSHFGIGPEGIYQWLDTAHRAWHAGWINDRAIGIDICQQPETKWQAYYADKRGIDLRIIDNRSHPRRGPKKVLELEERTRQHAYDLLLDLCRLFEIPFTYPRSDAALTRKELQAFSGIVGHHHISRRKWDVAPWLRAIVED